MWKLIIVVFFSLVAGCSACECVKELKAIGRDEALLRFGQQTLLDCLVFNDSSYSIELSFDKENKGIVMHLSDSVGEAVSFGVTQETRMVFLQDRVLMYLNQRLMLVELGKDQPLAEAQSVCLVFKNQELNPPFYHIISPAYYYSLSIQDGCVFLAAKFDGWFLVDCYSLEGLDFLMGKAFYDDGSSEVYFAKDVIIPGLKNAKGN